MRILVVNAGSSSLKLRVLSGSGDLAGSVDLEAPDGRAGEEETARALADVGAIDHRGRATVDAAGHRVVHGGERFEGPVLVDDGVRRALAELASLAPLHQQVSLDAMDVVDRLLPGVPAVACFDTAFHATLPVAAATYPLPEEWRRRWPLRRYGFHGLSHAYASRRLRQLLGAGAASRVVVCHLGSGASLAAVRDGASVDTTMGFTPLDGLVMATRSGGLDPGLVLWLQSTAGLDAAEVASGLEHRSGLLALAGTADMRDVVDGEAEGDPRAVLALAVYVHRFAAGFAAMAAALGGVDAVAFTGGVGERSPAVRSRAAASVGFLGVALDPVANAAAGGDAEADVSAPGSAVRSWVVPAREDIEIARGVREVLARG